MASQSLMTDSQDVDPLMSPSMATSGIGNQTFATALSVRLSKALSKHSNTQTNWIKQIAKIKEMRDRSNLNDTRMKRQLSKKLTLKGIPGVIVRQKDFGYDEHGVKIPSMFWKHKGSARVRSKDTPDLQSRRNGFFQTMRGGDVAYITTQTKNPMTMLWSTAPTKRKDRGASLHKDMALSLIHI